MRISDWSSDVCSSDLRQLLLQPAAFALELKSGQRLEFAKRGRAQFTVGKQAEPCFEGFLGIVTFKIVTRVEQTLATRLALTPCQGAKAVEAAGEDRKSTRLNSSH